MTCSLLLIFLWVIAKSNICFFHCSYNIVPLQIRFRSKGKMNKSTENNYNWAFILSTILSIDNTSAGIYLS